MSILRNPATTVILLLGILYVGIPLIWSLPAIRLPGNQIGYQPVQPIAYSHRLHAGELQIPCLYCHHGAEKSRHAGIPASNICMNCHRFVTATFGAVRQEDELTKKENAIASMTGKPLRSPKLLVSEELQKLFDAMGVNPREKMAADPTKVPHPIVWNQIHKLPDFVYFDHRPHVSAGVPCQDCHGPVQSMEKMRQFADLSMGWCVNCHRTSTQQGVNGKRVEASIDCSTCHY